MLPLCPEPAGHQQATRQWDSGRVSQGLRGVARTLGRGQEDRSASGPFTRWHVKPAARNRGDGLAAQGQSFPAPQGVPPARPRPFSGWLVRFCARREHLGQTASAGNFYTEPRLGLITSEAVRSRMTSSRWPWPPQ